MGELKYKNILLDLDGTLIDALEFIHLNLNKTLKSNGYAEIELQKTKSAMGLPLSGFLMSCAKASAENEGIEADEPLLKERAESLLNSYKEEYEAESADYIYVYPGAADGLKQLKEDGAHLILVTNRLYYSAEKTLELCGLDKYFDGVVGTGSYSYSKPAKELSENIARDFAVDFDSTIMVGDGESDYQFAKNAGCDFCHCRYGMSSEEDFADHSPDYIALSFKEALSCFYES